MSLRSHSLCRAGVSALLVLAAMQAARADTTPAATYSVTVTGSTALKGFFTAPGSTNDWIDMNNDGIKGYNDAGGSTGPTPFVQQIAPTATISGGSVTGYTVSANTNGVGNAAYLSVQYRGTGSVNGLVELVNYNLNATLPSYASYGDPGALNRTTVTSGGTLQYTVGPNGAGPGGFPQGPLTSVDAAILDVSIPWAVQGATATAQWNLKPTAAGYGRNAIPVVNAVSMTNKLASLTSTSNGMSLNLNVSAPDSKTVFGTPVAFAPISFVSNHGTGVQNVSQSALAFINVTGRMADGTNLIVATRDSGSGTRNGAMNSIGVDPSFGMGENIGDLATGAAANLKQVLGPHFQPTNLDSTGIMEAVVANSRLAIGYVSTTTGKSDQGTGKLETLGVTFDLEGGTTPIRPTASSIVNNNNIATAYRIGGIATFGTVGDPLATTINSNFAALNGNPQMANPGAAAYIRNIYESIKQYTTNPTSTANYFSPAATLITSNFIPIAAMTQVQSATDATTWVNNPNFASAVNTAGLGISGLNTGAYGSGAAPYGLVPTRENLTASTYSDGQTLNYRYFDSTGAPQTVNAGAALNLRNAIAGDFTGSGARNIAQIPAMMAAVANPAAWAALPGNHSGLTGSNLGTAAIPEILGDFNGDGNFDSKDVRYFADGLAIQSTGPNAGHVDRKAAFTAVDNNTASGNYFNTTLKTGKPYAAGDARGDIAGSAAGPNPGGAPTGNDNTVDAKDLNYVIDQIKLATGSPSGVVPVTTGDSVGQFSTLLSRAITNPTVGVRADFSADMNGDGNINFNDLSDIVQNTLGTQFGDVNLDGMVNDGDLNLLLTNFGHAGGWEQGNFLGTATVGDGDLNLLLSHFNFRAGFLGGSEFVMGASNPMTSATPEPASLALVALGAGALLCRRRRS